MAEFVVTVVERGGSQAEAAQPDACFGPFPDRGKANAFATEFYKIAAKTSGFLADELICVVSEIRPVGQSVEEHVLDCYGYHIEEQEFLLVVDVVDSTGWIKEYNKLTDIYGIVVKAPTAEIIEYAVEANSPEQAKERFKTVCNKTGWDYEIKSVERA